MMAQGGKCSVKNIVVVPLFIAVLVTISFSAQPAEPGTPPPQMREFHFDHAPKYPNPMTPPSSEYTPEDLSRILDDIGVAPDDREPIVAAYGAYCELIRKPGEDARAAAGSLKGALDRGPNSPESTILLQQAMDAQQNLNQAKRNAFEEVTKKMNDRQRAQTFLYIFALNSVRSEERVRSTTDPQQETQTELPRPATGVRLRPSAPATPAQPPATPKP